jgi:mercuric ion transport protein
MKDRLLATGIIGSIIAAICCFTPLLVWALALTGFAAFAGWVDYVAIPLLGIFIAITLIALARRRQA